MKFLIVVDMQEDFVNEVFGSDAAKAIVPYVAEQARSDEYDWVIFTRDWHNPFDERYFMETRMLPPHCVAYTKGAEFVEGVVPDNYPIIIVDKDTFGAIGLEDIIIDKTLWNYNPNHEECEIHIMGLCTDICVISNALALRMWFPGFRIIVHEKGCAGTTPQKHAAALSVMESNLIEVEYDV